MCVCVCVCMYVCVIREWERENERGPSWYASSFLRLAVLVTGGVGSERGGGRLVGSVTGWDATFPCDYCAVAQHTAVFQYNPYHQRKQRGPRGTCVLRHEYLPRPNVSSLVCKRGNHAARPSHAGRTAPLTAVVVGRPPNPAWRARKPLYALTYYCSLRAAAAEGGRSNRTFICIFGNCTPLASAGLAVTQRRHHS